MPASCHARNASPAAIRQERTARGIADRNSSSDRVSNWFGAVRVVVRQHRRREIETAARGGHERRHLRRDEPCAGEHRRHDLELRPRGVRRRLQVRERAVQRGALIGGRFRQALRRIALRRFGEPARDLRQRVAKYRIVPSVLLVD
jgi:hypothetical protein